jgi:hypothetical protein
MSRLCLVLVLAVSVSGCSLITVTPLKVSDRSQYSSSSYGNTQKRQKTARKPTCTQSNWAAGVDMVAAVGGGALAFHSDMETEASVSLALTSVAAFASMIYGFSKTSECRSQVNLQGFSSSGGGDWAYAPAIASLVGLAVLLSKARSGGGGSSDPDLCSPGELRTAMCNDGVYSCSKRRSGTCSWHRGVRYWIRKPYY